MRAIERSGQIAHQARASERVLQYDLNVFSGMVSDPTRNESADITQIRAQLDEPNRELLRCADVRARAGNIIVENPE